MKRRLLAWAVFLAVFLTACSAGKDAASMGRSGEEDAVTAGQNAASPAPRVEIDTAEKEIGSETYHLERQTLSLPEPLRSATAQTVLDDTVFVGGFAADGAALSWLTLDGASGAMQLPDGAEYLYALCLDGAGGVWLLSGSVPAAYRNADGSVVFLDETPEGNLSLTHYDGSFCMQETIPLQTKYTGNNERFTQLTKTDDGFLLLSAELLIHLDDTVAEIARESAEFDDGWRFVSMQKKENSLFVLMQSLFDASGAELRLFTADTLTPQDGAAMQTGLTGLGLCADGQLLLGSDQNVSAYTPETGEEDILLAWRELGAADLSEQLWQTDDGFFFYTPNAAAITVLRWLPGEAVSKTRLSLAIAASTPGLYPFTQMIRDFNLSQEQYLVEYTIYSDAETEEAQAADLLRMQIMAGQAPDLYAFYTDGYTAIPLTPEAVCTDLLPLLGQDFTADKLLPNLYALLTQDGALYQLPLTVDVDTMLAPASLLPETGVTLADLEDARGRMPDGWVTIDSWNTPENLFSLCTSYCIGMYTDKTSGTCDFETQSFYDYLAWCKNWGGDGTMPETRERTLVKLSWTNSIGQLAGRSKAAEEYWFGEPNYTYIGYPTADGTGGSGYRILTSLGISPQCRDVSGAKAFLEYCFSYLQEDALPANDELLRLELKEYMAGRRTDWRGEVQQVSEADAEQFVDLLNSITVLEGLDAPLTDILCQEANVYFAGGCTAEQAAKNIQSRASLYLQEQYPQAAG